MVVFNASKYMRSWWAVAIRLGQSHNTIVSYSNFLDA